MTVSVLTPSLEHFCTVSVEVGAPQEIGETPTGRRRVIPILGGTVEGAHIGGHVLPGGADFQSIRSQTFTDIHARYVIQTDDNETIYVENTGIRTGSAEDIAALAEGRSVPPERIYFRSYPRFETAAPRLAWLNTHLFVGTGARYINRVELNFFVVR
ncbi:DUF3237 domain-containing protein [Allopusillimonas ginsengisoli]|uniref:DUF3237 domain-containing protein n=1 Tax=Allopusillimonas ginsengisoli TaxID=453575 RepID=UPI0026BAFC26